MNVFTLHFIRKDDEDEVLKVYKRNNDHFKCCFFPAGLRSSFTFNLTKNMLIEYIRGTLRMVAEDDMDPYDKVQVTTNIHPRILFHVSDIIDVDSEAYDRMWDMLTFAWNMNVTKNELSPTERNNINANSQRVQNFQRYYSGPNPEDSDS